MKQLLLTLVLTLPTFATGSPAWGEFFGTKDGLSVAVNYVDLSQYPMGLNVLSMSVVIQSADHRPIPERPESLAITVIYSAPDGNTHTKSAVVEFPPSTPGETWSLELHFCVPLGSRAKSVSVRRIMPEVLYSPGG